MTSEDPIPTDSVEPASSAVPAKDAEDLVETELVPVAPGGIAANPDEGTRQLIEKAQAGDVEALDDLFQGHYQQMVDLARRRLGVRLRSKESPDDLAQTTFREAARDFRRYEYRGEGSFLRWLVRILQNKIRDKAEYYAAGKRDMSRERGIEANRDPDSGGDSGRYEPASPDLSVTRVVARNEQFSVLKDLLTELSSDHRRAITLVFFEGLPLREAGERMGGRSEDAVRMLLRRAEKRLSELMKARGGV